MNCLASRDLPRASCLLMTGERATLFPVRGCAAREDRYQDCWDYRIPFESQGTFLPDLFVEKETPFLTSCPSGAKGFGARCYIKITFDGARRQLND